MIDYYVSRGQFDLAESEIETLRKRLGTVKNPKFKENLETSIKNAEYAMRIKQGNYEGAEEHYKKMMETVKPLLPIGKASYSYALGKLYFLKGEPERAREYLQVACDLGGDTKYKMFAEEILKAIEGE